MKTLTFIISLLLICIVPAFSQDQNAVDAFTFSIIWDAIKQFFLSVNWLFVFVFMLSTWLINDTSEATNIATWFNWFSKIPKAVRALLVGIITILFFVWGYQITARTEIFKLLLSLLAAMVIYKFGIDRIFRYISTRIGLKFE